MKYKISFIVLVFTTITCVFSQNHTRDDELRGAITPERAWWDLLHYDLAVEVSPTTKSIAGTNTITYKVMDKGKVMQIDLQAPMKIDKVVQNGKVLSFTSEGNAHFIQLKKQRKDSEQQLTIYF